MHNHNDQDPIKKETLATLDRLWRENGHVQGFRYFADTAYTYSIPGSAGEVPPEVVILGTGIPEALLMAFQIRYRYLLGGSHALAAWSDDLVPRDTDPVSRSILGSICSPDGARLSESLFIIPVSSDSMRKIAYLLREDGFQTLALDVPPDHADPRAAEQWEKQLLRMMDAIAAHTRKRFSLHRLKKAVRAVTLAHYRLGGFLRSADGYRPLTGSGKILIRNSYYFAGDIEEWSENLNALMRAGNLRSPQQADAQAAPSRPRKEDRTREDDRLRKGDRIRSNDRPGILLTGSPVIFPNYKIPFLIEDAGLSIAEYLDESTVQQAELLSPRSFRSTAQAVHAIAGTSLKHDASAAYICNDALMAAVYRAIRGGRIEGIIFHVLKGQIEYDFEMARMEELFESCEIPVFRLETDYQDHDIEQLRIRLEAFREMLSQARCNSGRKAV